MKFSSKNPLSDFLHGLFETYENQVPDVKKVTQALIQKGVISDQSEIVNDHIAFRTLGLPHLGIASIERIFMQYGYQKRDYYRFEEKKLNAYWYAPPEPHFPRIFISELCANELTENTQNILHRYTQNITVDPSSTLDFNNAEAVIDFFQKPLWELPSWEDYHALLQESEYAAWVIYNRYYLNHYTISVHEMPAPLNNLAAFNEFLLSIPVRLNTAGGIIKESPDKLLLQSSTVAQTVMAEFAGGDTHEISGSYVEFAERRSLPEYQNLDPKSLQREQRREGFEAGIADKIFESTFTSQTQKDTHPEN